MKGINHFIKMLPKPKKNFEFVLNTHVWIFKGKQCLTVLL